MNWLMRETQLVGHELQFQQGYFLNPQIHEWTNHYQLAASGQDWLFSVAVAGVALTAPQICFLAFSRYQGGNLIINLHKPPTLAAYS